MGIRVYESEDMFSDEDGTCTCSCCCTSCHKSTTATTNTNSSSSSTFSSSSNAYKDIVGNCKEVRIEENTSNLRIVGNNNRIRITLNTGDLIVIGNNTRLKIITNHGHIKYTGNDGRISLGNQSSQQQLDDYIGCNGTLKIVNSMKFSSKSKCAGTTSNATDSGNKNKSPTVCDEQVKKTYCKLANQNSNDRQYVEKTEMKSPRTSACRNNKSKEKSHSYGGSNSPDEKSQWQAFNTSFHDNAPKSMPNLTATQYEAKTYCNREPAATSIVQTIGNIVIANASNICIAPFARNVTMKV